MILSDRHIQDAIGRGIFLINPFNPEYLQPSSVDLHIDEELRTGDGDSFNIKDESYTLKPLEFALVSTIETVNIPIDIVGHVDGRSSLARRGVLVYTTLIDSGYNGNLTLALFNMSSNDFELKYGDSLCQILFEQVSSPVMRPYGSVGLGSKYQGSEGVTESKI